MKTTCTRCGARTALPDDRAGRDTRIRCRKCGATFPAVPSGQAPAPSLAGVGTARSGPRSPSPPPRTTTRLAEAPSRRSRTPVEQQSRPQHLPRGASPSRGGPETGVSSSMQADRCSSESSAMFSLAALAQTATATPVVAATREDSDLIDLKQVGDEARDATVTPIPTTIPLLPLGVNPLGTPTCDPVQRARPRAPDPGMSSWMLVASAVAIAAVIVGGAFALRSGRSPEAAAPASAFAAAELPDPGPDPVTSAALSSPAPSVSAEPAVSPSAPPPASATPAPRPPRPPRPVVERDPPPPPPPVKPANPCAHCGTDLSCSMACRVKGG